MRNMKVLELFSGTGSFSKVAKERGHEIFTIDNEKSFNPSLCIDILELTPEIVLEKFGHPDVIWASPPCQCFSVASVYRHWKDGKPIDDRTLKAIEIVKKTLLLIQQLKPKYWIIENPRGMLRKQDFMPNDKRKTVTYCQYGLEYQKATDLWNNIDSWIPKPMCSPKSPCHVRAPRGSNAGIQGTNGYRANRQQKHPIDSTRLVIIKPTDRMHRKGNHPDWSYKVDRSAVARAIVPRELCEEIIKSIESTPTSD